MSESPSSYKNNFELMGKICRKRMSTLSKREENLNVFRISALINLDADSYCILYNWCNIDLIHQRSA